MMTRKNYERFAECIKYAKGDCNNLIVNLCNYLKEDNEKFDTERFLKASGEATK